MRAASLSLSSLFNRAAMAFIVVLMGTMTVSAYTVTPMESANEVARNGILAERAGVISPLLAKRPPRMARLPTVPMALSGGKTISETWRRWVTRVEAWCAGTFSFRSTGMVIGVWKPEAPIPRKSVLEIIVAMHASSRVAGVSTYQS